MCAFQLKCRFFAIVYVVAKQGKMPIKVENRKCHNCVQHSEKIIVASIRGSAVLLVLGQSLRGQQLFVFPQWVVGNPVVAIQKEAAVLLFSKNSRFRGGNFVARDTSIFRRCVFFSIFPIFTFVRRRSLEKGHNPNFSLRIIKDDFFWVP